MSADDLVLLEHEEQILPSRRKSLRRHVFVVPAGVAALRVWLEPVSGRPLDAARATQLASAALEEQRRAALADGVVLDAGAPAGPPPERLAAALRNLVNLTLTDPAGRHRGRWDRNAAGVDAEEDVIAASWASPGYRAGPLPAGRWQATLEVHEVLQQFRVQLRISAMHRAPPAPAPVAGSASPLPSRQFVDPLPAGWLRGELHCHSTASDGAYAPRELVRRACAVGLDFIALTDHNTTFGLVELDAAGLPVIAGCELTTFHGHFLALGLAPGDVAPPWYEGERALSPTDLADEVHRRGGLFGLAHPFVLGNPVCCGCRLERAVPGAAIDLLEVWSRGAEEPLAMRHALRRFDELRRAGRRVVALAGRDWHGPAQEGSRFPATVVQAPPEVRPILAALRRGACYLSVGPLLGLWLVRAGRRAGPGDDLGLPRGIPDARSTLEIDVARIGGDALLRVLLGGDLLLERWVSGEAVLEIPAVRAASGGVRVELWDADGRPLALSNPVEFFRADAEGEVR